MANMFTQNNYNSGSSTFSGSQIGGGFIENENFNSQNKSNKAVIPYDERKLSQITIKQIQTAKIPQPDEHLVIDGQEISQLQMIAQIQSIDIQSSHTTLKVNDYTGTLDAKQWSNDNQSPQRGLQHLMEGSWVKIIGRINNFGGKCSINVFQIIPIINYDEVTHHFLEVIYAHLENTKPVMMDKQMMNNDNNMNNNMNMSYNQNQNQNQNNNNFCNFNNNNNNNNNYNANLPKIQNLVLNIINSAEFVNSETGCNVEILFQRLPNENVNEIRTAIDELANAGHLYSTVDDDHYKYSGDQQ